MEESKNYTKVYSLILIVSIFAGWQAMLLAAVLLLLFGKIDENVKKMIITVVSFAAGLALFGLFWDLITGGISLAINGIKTLITFLNSYLDKPITILNLQRYLLNPIEIVVGYLDTGVNYALMFMRFCFIIAILTGKGMKSNFIFDKIQKYVNKFTDYVGDKAPVMQAAVTPNVTPVAPAAQTIDLPDQNQN